jgi:hypothetical protein
VRERLRSLWRTVRRRRPVPEWPGDSAGEDPFQEALVPLGPPRRPLRSDGVALSLPEPEEWDVDAYGRAADG